MAKRKEPPLTLQRRMAKKEPQSTLYIYCEGKNTEPHYLRCFSTEYGNKLVELVIVDAAGAPLTLVSKACQKKAELDLAAVSGDSFQKKFEVWAVFDRDEHPNFNKAIQLAVKKGVYLAVSNPCFDLWGLLHFQHQDGEIHRHKAQTSLQKKMPTYEKSGSKKFDYELMRPHYALATSRAKTLIKRRTEEGNPGGNPSTKIYELLSKIELFGKAFYSG